MNKQIEDLARSGNLIGVTLCFNNCGAVGNVINYGFVKKGTAPFAWDCPALLINNKYASDGLRVKLDSGPSLWVLNETEVMCE